MIRLGALLVLLAGPALGQSDPAEAALAAKSRLEAAARQLDEAGSARDRVAALTETVRAYEDGLVALRDGLRRASIREQTLTAELNAKSDEVARLLGVLQTMGRAPAPLLLLHPSGPTGTARSGMILSDVTPALQAEVDILRADLEEVALLRQLQDSAAQTLREGLDGVQTARADLSAAISDRTDLPRRYTEDPVQTALLIATAETLDAFASGLTETVPGDPDGELPEPDTLRGTLPLPVQGDLLRDFGEADAAGITRPGWIIATRPRALVTTPVPATLRFRGALLDYGTVTILEPAADVLIVIAGMAEVFGTPGEVLPAGSPIGLMGGQTPSADGFLTAPSRAGGVPLSETLYIEIRETGEPVDPAAWFALE